MTETSNMPEPNLDGWQELMEAAAKNARGLVADARLLLEAGRLTRAYALAELAAEEVGKLMMLAAVAVRVAMDDPVDLDRFWRKFRDHDRKAMNAVFWDHLAMADPVAFMAGDREALLADKSRLVQANREIDVMLRAKNLALYVGFDRRSGQLQVPWEQIHGDWPRMMVEAVEGALGQMAQGGLPPPPGFLSSAKSNPELSARFDALRAKLDDLPY